MSESRVDVRKTYKLFIAGAFPRSESGRSYAVTDRRGNFLANAALASRKDARDAVVAARKAVPAWAGATPYNRGQILYRIAEMMEGRRAQFGTEVGGRRLEVVLPASLGGGNPVRNSKPTHRSRSAGKGAAVLSGDTLTSPMQGTIVKVAVVEGQRVEEGDLIVVLEAMKMEQPLKAHKAGTVTQLTADVGASVDSGAPLCEIKD